MIYDNERIWKEIDREVSSEYRGYCVRESAVFDMMEKMRDEYEGIIKLLREEKEKEVG